MKTLNLKEIKGNTANPRQIKETKFKKLVNSVLVFPEMLSLRPIILNKEKVILGGNMRYKALSFIATLSEVDILNRLKGLNDYTTKTAEQQNRIVDFWGRFLDNPQIEVEIAENLTDAQQQEFIIKDNASFGEWDWDALANEWESSQLEDWGIDCWQMPDPSKFTPVESASEGGLPPSYDEANEDFDELFDLPIPKVAEKGNGEPKTEDKADTDVAKELVVKINTKNKGKEEEIKARIEEVLREYDGVEIEFK